MTVGIFDYYAKICQFMQDEIHTILVDNLRDFLDSIVTHELFVCFFLLLRYLTFSAVINNEYLKIKNLSSTPSAYQFPSTRAILRNVK